MSHVVNEQDTYDLAIPSTDIPDQTYPTVVNQAITSLTNRTNNIGLTLGAVATITSWEDVNEGDILGVDTTGNAPFSLPIHGRADFLRNGFMEVAAKIVGLRNLTAQPYDEQISLGAGILGQTQWVADFAANVPGVSQQDVTFAYSISYPIGAVTSDPTLTFGNSLNPRGIRAVRARVGKLGGAAHAAAPATKRILELCYSDLYASPPATVIVASATDSAASGATYDAFHDIILTIAAGQALIANSTRMWFVRLKGETGANSVVGHGLIDLRVCYTLVP